MVSLSTQFVIAAACLASLASAAPQVKPASVPIYRPKAASRSVKDLVEKDQARGASFAKSAGSGDAPVVNGDVSYYADTYVTYCPRSCSY